MAREISIRDEYLTECDEGTLKAVLAALGKEFLLIPLDDFRIEVDDMDYAAVTQALREIKRDIEINSKK